jgi:DNA replication protein DnaC
MRDLMAELKELRLHGMASAWEELASQGEASATSWKWLLEHLLQQEQADRAVRSVNHQMSMAKLPMHRWVSFQSAPTLQSCRPCLRNHTNTVDRPWMP